MKKKPKCISAWVQKKAKEDTAFAGLIKFLYHLFANNFIQAFVSLFGALVIAIMIDSAYYGLWFKLSCGFYIVATIMIAWANDYTRHQIEEAKTLQNMLHGLGTTMRSTAILLQKCAKQLKQSNSINRTRAILPACDIDFQTAAFNVCANIRNTLSKKEEKNDVYVTVYQKKTNNTGTYCRMIAHSEDHEVTSYDKEYIILPEHKDQFGVVEYHTYVFAKGIKEVTSFHSKELVEKAFCVHESCEERENRIQQYICIPISPAGLGVTFLLQVDTNEESFFGSTEEAVNEFAKNIIYPYAQFLHMIYEQSRVVEQLIK